MREDWDERQDQDRCPDLPGCRSDIGSASAIAMFGGATNIEFTGKNRWIAGNRIGAEFNLVYRDRVNSLFDFEEKKFELYVNASTGPLVGNALKSGQFPRTQTAR